jgi:hypothetical protein
MYTAPVKRSSKNSRVYVCGMQSSGSSIFSYFLAQIPDSLAVIDLWVRQPCPPLMLDMPVSIKTCISVMECYLQDVSVFKPTLSILFMRDPVDIYVSLKKKSYFNDGGDADDKFQIYETMFRERETLFDLSICYEDFTKSPLEVAERLRQHGVPIQNSALSFKRGLEEVIDFARSGSTWCRDNYQTRWTHGNIHTDNLPELHTIRTLNPDPEVIAKMRKLCPRLMDAYHGAVSAQF